MTIKALVILLVIVAIALGVAFIFRFRGGNAKLASTASTGDSAGFIVGRNAIYVAEQSPSRTVSVAVARLEKPGFVVIHEDSAGKPGKILGTSSVLPTGEIKNLTPIGLSRTTKDGETLYAMLHLDDGDNIFDPAKDKPALDSLGSEPVMMIFTVSVGANELGAVNL